MQCSIEYSMYRTEIVTYESYGKIILVHIFNKKYLFI